MNKVYAVFHDDQGWYGCRTLKALFSTQQKAENYIHDYKKNDLELEEIEVDEYE